MVIMMTIMMIANGGDGEEFVGGGEGELSDADYKRWSNEGP